MSYPPATRGLPIPLSGATVATRYVGGNASGAPLSGTFAVGDFVVNADASLFVCTVAGSPGTWVDSATIGPSVSSVFTRSGAVVATDGDYYGVVAAAKTGATAVSRYAGATASGAPASGTFAIGDFVIDQTGKVFICTVAGTPGTWVNAGAAGNLVTSVFTRTGAVVAATNDYTYAQIANAANAIAVSNLAAGSAGQVLGGTGPSYAFPPGYELDYVAITSAASITSTSSASPDAVVTGTSKAYAAVKVNLEFWCPRIDSAVNETRLVFLRGATVLGYAVGDAGGALSVGGYTAKAQDTPGAATFAYSVKGYLTGAGGAGTVQAGAGGNATTFLPAYLRVTLA